MPATEAHPAHRLAVLARLPLLLAALVLGVGCGSNQSLEPRPLPPHIQVTGKWDTNWGRMVLQQTGDRFSGTFEYKDGRINGTVSGDLMLFEWEQPADKSAARLAVSGRGYFRISQDGRRLAGQWGYDQSRTGGGTWKAEIVDY